jgi:hypothetical protein
MPYFEIKEKDVLLWTEGAGLPNLDLGSKMLFFGLTEQVALLWVSRARATLGLGSKMLYFGFRELDTLLWA